MKAVRQASVLLFLCGALQILHGQNDNLKREIEKIIRYEAYIDFNVVPGVMVGVIDGSNTYINSFGEQLDPDSIYELGGLTKPVVAWLVDQALDSLGWNHDVNVCTFLPDSLCQGNYLSLTIDQVINYRSGLPRIPNIHSESKEPNDGLYADYTFEHLSRDITTMKPNPGNYGYSNVAYAMLYWLFEKVGGLESYATQKLFKPYNLNKTGWNFPDEKIAQGHNIGGLPVSPWHASAMATSLGLKSSMDEMMIILEMISPKLIQATPPLTKSLKKELKALYKADE